MRSLVLSLLALAAQAVALPEYVGTEEPFAAEAVYFLITDRFVDGDPTNNQETQGGEYPTFDLPVLAPNGVEANIGYLGGDFRGVLDHADYIRDMGFTAVWLTPVVDNPDQSFSGGDAIGESIWADRGKAGYHGYWGVNFYRLDEHLPSTGLDYTAFVTGMNSHGLDVVLDIVANHGSPSFTMPRDQPGFGELYDASGTLVADHQNLLPRELDYSNPLHRFYHREPDLVQLSNLNEDNPALRDYLINSYLHWLDQGAAALRIDTIKHVSNDFWKEMSDRVRARHPGLFMFAEHFSYEAREIAAHQRPENGAISVLDFPGQRAMQKVFGDPAGDYADLLDYLHLEDGIYVNPYELMTFYDNHDMPRMDAADEGFIDAHNWLFTSRGIPIIYYGSEIGFMRGTAEHEGNRNYFGVENIEKARGHPIRRALAAIAQVRLESVALQRGLQVNLNFDGHTAMFLRVYQSGGKGQLALVMLNKGDEPVAMKAADLLDSGEWHDVIGGDTKIVAAGSDGLTARVPAHGVRVWMHDGPVRNPRLVARLEALQRAVSTQTGAAGLPDHQARGEQTVLDGFTVDQVDE